MKLIYLQTLKLIYFKVYYKPYKNIHQRVIKAAKSHDFNKGIASLKNVTKTTWAIINTMRGKDKPKIFIIKLKIGGKLCANSMKVSN